MGSLHGAFPLLELLLRLLNDLFLFLLVLRQDPQHVRGDWPIKLEVHGKLLEIVDLDVLVSPCASSLMFLDTHLLVG